MIKTVSMFLITLVILGCSDSGQSSLENSKSTQSAQKNSKSEKIPSDAKLCIYNVDSKSIELNTGNRYKTFQEFQDTVYYKLGISKKAFYMKSENNEVIITMTDDNFTPLADTYFKLTKTPNNIDCYYPYKIKILKTNDVYTVHNQVQQGVFIRTAMDLGMPAF